MRLTILVLAFCIGDLCAAAVKDRGTTALGRSGTGTQLPENGWADYLLPRIDLMDPLAVRVAAPNSPAAQKMCSWETISLPSCQGFLFPDKPAINHGNDIWVSVA